MKVARACEKDEKEEGEVVLNCPQVPQSAILLILKSSRLPTYVLLNIPERWDAVEAGARTSALIFCWRNESTHWS